MPAGTYILTWTGTATGRVYNTGATPPSYAASPITVTLDGTANVEVEFTASGGTRTLQNVQLEAGSVASAFERRPIGTELDLCHRYYRRWTNNGAYVQYYGLGLGSAQSTALASVFVKTKMRTPPATLENSNVGVFRAASAVIGGGTLSLINATLDGVEVRYTGSAGQFVTGETITFLNNNAATSFIGIGAEL
jgi:hypothetical protein